VKILRSLPAFGRAFFYALAFVKSLDILKALLYSTAKAAKYITDNGC
jgi:hypothetical protein